MLYQNNKYSMNFKKPNKIKLRYFALLVAVFAFFSTYFYVGGKVEKQNISQTTISIENPILAENIEKYSQISPAAGNRDIYMKDILKAENNHKISIQESKSYIIVDIPKPNPKPEWKIVSNIPKPELSPHLKMQKKVKDKSFVAQNNNDIFKPAKRPFAKITKEKIKLDNLNDVVSKTIIVSRGDTFSKILEKLGIGASEIYDISTAIQHEYNPKDMQIGQKITVYKKMGKFVGLDIQKSLLDIISLRSVADGRFGVAQKTVKTKEVTFAKQGTINGSLYKSALNAGVPENLIIEMIKIYSWAVDFQRDIVSNDKFKIMYNMTMTEDGEFVPDMAKILYVSLDLRNSGDISLYRYEDREGDVGYFEEDGRSVRKALMRTPINGARLTSGFGMRRHPILGYSKMHKGMDFAAPRGTPIYAAGDGRIVYIGRRGGFGNFIKIRHYSGLETAYAHMRGFKKGLKRGSKVKQGQTIGYVGTTGNSTGPHLHYEVHSNGRVINPRKIKAQKGKILAGADLKLFKAEVNKTKSQFAKLQKNILTASSQNTLTY